MQIHVRLADRMVLTYGFSLGSLGPGATVEECDAPTEAALVSAINQPNGGVTISVDHKTITSAPAPAPDATLVAQQQDTLVARSDLATQYASAITRLDQIIGATPGAATNTQRDQAISDLATILKRTLRLLKDVAT